MARLTLAGPDDLERVVPMVEAFHAEAGIEGAELRPALQPLLDGSPHGALWLIGPSRAPVGYIVVSFGWSLEFGGLDGLVDEFYIRDGVRGRGMGSEALVSLVQELARSGVRAVHLEVHDENAPAERLYSRIGFRRRSGYGVMSWVAGTAATA